MKINGIITAMVTPLDDNGSINEKGTRKLVETLINQGIHGLFILGTNGEFFVLSEEEKLNLAKIVVDQVKKRVPIFAGAGGISTESVIDLSRKLEKIGIDAVSIITPYLLKFTDEELIRHYEMIAANTTLPIILYNIPANTKNNISEYVFSKLIKNPSIIGIKDSSGDIDNFKSYLKYKGRDDFSFLMGSDSKIVEALLLGADGAVASTSNVLSKTDVGMYNCVREGKISEAESLQESIDDFREICKVGTIPSGLKVCLRLIGQEVGKTKSPIMDVEEEYREQFIEVLKKYESFEGYKLEKS